MTSVENNQKRIFYSWRKIASTAEWAVVIAMGHPLTVYYLYIVPQPRLIESVVIAWSVGYAVLVILFVRAAGSLRINTFEAYIALVMVFPLYSGIQALLEFGQPFFYGVLAERYIWLSGIALLIYRALESGEVALSTISRALILLSWFTALYVILFKYFLFGAVGQQIGGGEGPNLVKDQVTRNDRLMFQAEFVVFGTYYYFFRLLKGFSLSSLGGFLFLAFPLVFIYQSRALLMAWMLGLVVSSVFSGPFLGAMIKGIKALVLLGISILILTFFDASYVSKLIDLLAAALRALVGVEGSDQSANARLLEVALTWPYVIDNCLIAGCGALSYQWEGGSYAQIFGYFYPKDVGWIGAIFVYGIVGLVVFHIMFIFARTNRSKSTLGRDGELVLVAKAILFYYFFYSIVTMKLVAHPSGPLIFVAIMYFYSKQNDRNGV